MATQRQISELELVLLKLQSTFGTAESSLLAADLFEAEMGAEISMDPAVSELALVGGGFPQNISVVGPLEAGVKLSIPMRTGGAESSAGLVGTLLKLCGFKETASDTDADLASDRYIYTPSNKPSEWKDATVWGYSGNPDTNASILRKVSNVMGSGKISLDFEKSMAKFEFTGKGAYTGAATAATQPTVTRTSSIITPALKSAVVSIMGDSDFDPISMEFDFGQDIAVTLKPSAANGKGMSIIAKRRISWKAKVYKDAVANIDPETPFLAQTTGAISVAWGTAPNKFTISTTKGQITSLGDADQGGAQTHDIGGICIDNDLSVQIDTAVA